MEKKKIYISGAIAHHDIEERKNAFKIAAAYCKVCGFEPVNPFDNIYHRCGVGEKADWRAHMRADLQMLLECDAICMMDGWEESKGAKLEHDVASTCGMTVYYESDVRTMRI
ncbi:MAG: DUF4406 domain-containing protein [Prevotellaceae bacterium]|nr:DUF4406 domain-containing protein [Prevotellaceae bacterium]